MDCHRCLIQWGFTVFDPVYYKNVNFTLPLSVNGTFCAFSTGYDAKGSTFLWHSMSHFNNVNVGVTGFVFDSRYTFTGLGYLAVCWQKQWGNLWAGYTEVLNWYFPLTTSQVYAVCLTKHTKNISSGHNWEPARIEEWNNSYARIHPDGDLGYSVIAICKAQQQWGFIARNANTTFTFPIMFTTLYAAMRTAYGVSGRDPSWDEIAIPSATVKQINLGSCYWASYVIAIGI